MNQFPPSPRGLFQMFVEIFASQGAPLVLTTPAANFATSFASVVDTGGKFATGVNDMGGKCAAGVNDTSGNFPTVSITPAANSPLLSMTSVTNNGQNIRLLRP